MPKYKLILEVKDSAGELKEIDAGIVNIDLTELSESDLKMLASKLDPIYATEQELSDAVSNANTIKYSDFKLKDETQEN